MRKKLHIVSLLAFLFLSCGQRNARKNADSGVPPGWSVGTSTEAERIMSGEEEETDAVHLIRHWKDLDSSVFRGKVPSREQIEKWKRAFEMANPKDTAWRFEVAYFKDKDHYQAVRDFIEIWHSQNAPDDDDERTEWRLLQWDPRFDDMPGSEAGRLFYIRDLFEDLMDYERGSQWDMTFYGWLWTDFMDFYIRILRQETDKRVSRQVAAALARERKAADKLHDCESAAYQTIQGDPVWPGSSFPYRVGMFGKECLGIEAKAMEYLLIGLMEGEEPGGMPSSITTGDVLREYDVFSETLTQDGSEEYDEELRRLLSDWASKKRSTLSNEKKAWASWMASRERVSALLDGVQKRAYDMATGIICREKLVLLKNRYNSDDGYNRDSLTPFLASTWWTDEDILAHNLEKLLEEDE